MNSGRLLDQHGAGSLPLAAFNVIGAALILLLAGYLAITALLLGAYMPLLPQMTYDFSGDLDPVNPRHGQTFTMTANRVDRVDVVLRVPETADGVPVVVRLRANGPEGASIMERRALLMGNGTWQVYAFALPGPLPEDVRQLYFEIENQDAQTTVIEDRISKWDRLPGGVFHMRRMAVWDDQDMVIQVYARPQPATLFTNPIAVAEGFFPTAAGPLLLLEVIAVLSILGVIGNHSLQPHLPVRLSWHMRYAIDVLIVAGILWLYTRFLLSGSYGMPAHWV